MARSEVALRDAAGLGGSAATKAGGAAAGSRTFWIACPLLFAALRIGFILIAPEPASDAAWYLNRGTEIADRLTYSEHGQPTAFWPVGYPAFLGAVFWIFGASPLTGVLANLALACGSLVLVFLICREAFDERTATLAALLLAVYPNNAAYTALLLTEHFFTFTLLLACWFYMRGWLLPCGIAFGVTTLTKTQAAALPLLLFALDTAPMVRRAGRVGLVVLAMVVTVSPWVIRNANVMGAPVLATNGGINLLYGNNPDADGTISNTDRIDAQVGFTVENQIAADRRARQMALQWVAEDPGGALALLPKKLLYIWVIDGEAVWGWQDEPLHDRHQAAFLAGRVLNQAFYAALLAGAAISAGLMLLYGPPSRWALIGFGVAGYFTLVSLVTFGFPRFHFPVMPFVCMYAAWAVIKLPRGGIKWRGGAS